MAYQHTNRRGDVYYIQVKERGGKVASSATRKPTGTLADRVPDGFEIYEQPTNAQVFVRKVRPTKILAAERALVERSVRELAKLEHFIVDVEPDAIVVYLTDAEPELAMRHFRDMDWMMPGQAQAYIDRLLKQSNYSKMMRFVLMDEEERGFAVERWCFLGSIDDWFFLDSGASLQRLAKKYVPHLGKESFFDLGGG